MVMHHQFHVSVSEERIISKICVKQTCIMKMPGICVYICAGELPIYNRIIQIVSRHTLPGCFRKTGEMKSTKVQTLGAYIHTYLHQLSSAGSCQKAWPCEVTTCTSACVFYRIAKNGRQRIVVHCGKCWISARGGVSEKTPQIFSPSLSAEYTTAFSGRADALVVRC